ncbi:hypothetical protein LguiA_001642 [Lonicera macranthoides]
MASSKMVSRLSSRIQPLLLKLNNKKTSSSSISPNNTSSIFNSTFPSQASASSTRNCISRFPVELIFVTSGVEQLVNDGAVAQCDSIGTVTIKVVHRVSELGFNSSRHLIAFMMADLWRSREADS